MKRRPDIRLAAINIGFGTASVVALAAFLVTQDTSAYPFLENLTFAGWILVSFGVVAAILIPGLTVYGLVTFLIWLPELVARRFSSGPNPTPPKPPAPAAVDPADSEDEWADIQAEIREESR